MSHNWDDQSYGHPVSHQTSRVNCQSTIMRDWWYDPARLVACNRRSRVLNMTIDLAATIHDFYNFSIA